MACSAAELGNKLDIWEGVYRSFPDTGCGDQLDRHPVWLRKCEAAARLELECLNAGKPGPGLLQPRNLILPIVVPLLAQDSKLRILDFGGGLGTGYFALKSARTTNARFEIDVVETAKTCELAGKVLPPLPDLRFLNQLPARPQKYDVIHAASSLHYVDDWRGLLAKFAELRPKYLVVTELTAGPIASFVTTQRYYDYRIPVWFWSLDEFCGAARTMGFHRIVAVPHLPTIRGAQMAPPMDNFPREFRLDSFQNMVFVSDASVADDAGALA